MTLRPIRPAPTPHPDRRPAPCVPMYYRVRDRVCVLSMAEGSVADIYDCVARFITGRPPRKLPVAVADRCQ
mgnify:FL=1